MTTASCRIWIKKASCFEFHDNRTDLINKRDYNAVNMNTWGYIDTCVQLTNIQSNTWYKNKRRKSNIYLHEPTPKSFDWTITSEWVLFWKQGAIKSLCVLPVNIMSFPIVKLSCSMLKKKARYENIKYPLVCLERFSSNHRFYPWFFISILLCMKGEGIALLILLKINRKYKRKK